MRTVFWALHSHFVLVVKHARGVLALCRHTHCSPLSSGSTERCRSGSGRTASLSGSTRWSSATTRLTIGCGMVLMTMAGALFRGQSPRKVPVGPSGTPTWHLRVSDLCPGRRHTPNTRVPARCTMRQVTRWLLVPPRPLLSKRPTRPISSLYDQLAQRRALRMWFTSAACASPSKRR